MTDESVTPCSLHGCDHRNWEEQHMLLAVHATRGYGYAVSLSCHRGGWSVRLGRRYFGVDGRAALVYAENERRRLGGSRVVSLHRGIADPPRTD